MLEAFSAAINAAGGVRAFARLANVQPSYVSRVHRGETPTIPDRLLAVAGIERVITYRRIPLPERTP